MSGGLDEVIAPLPVGDNRLEDAIEQERSHSSPKLQYIKIICFLIFFSIGGALGRVGIIWLGSYPEAPIDPIAGAQFLGSFILGFVAEDTSFFIRKSPLYIGIATGFCGSMTTFSGFIHACFTALTSSSRDAGYNVIAFLSELLLTLGLSYFGIRMGAVIRNLIPQGRRIPECGFVISTLGLLSITAAAVIAATMSPYTWQYIAFTAIFAPFGTFIRFLLGLYFNPKFSSFPLGTFMANVTGTMILSALVIAAGTTNSAVIIQAAIDGFCGCLTTISTFALELITLRAKHSIIYASTSIFIALALMIIILGTWTWTG